MANDILEEAQEEKVRNEHFEIMNRDALRTVLSFKQGRRFIWNHLAKCGFSQQAFVVGHPDVTAFNNGKQDVAIGLIADIDSVAPEAFHLMAKEAKEDRDLYDRSTSSTSGNANGDNNASGNSQSITSNNSSSDSIAIIAGRQQ